MQDSSWQVAALAAIAAGIYLLIRGIRGVLNAVPVPWCAGPLGAEQALDVPRAGPAVLYFDTGKKYGRLSLRPHGGLAFTLQEQSSGFLLEGRQVLFPVKTNLRGTYRYELLRFDIPRPGRYRLRIAGLEQHPKAPECGFQLAPPASVRRLVASILLIVFGAQLAVAGLVFTILMLSGGFNSA